MALIKDRRDFLASSSKLVGGCGCGLVLSSLGGCSIFGGDDEEEKEVNNEQDVKALNKILEQEYKIIAAYEVGLDMGLLNQSAVDIAEDFRKDHIFHSELIIALIRRLNGRPIRPLKTHEFGFKRSKLQQAKDVINFLRDFEKQISRQYLKNIPEAKDKEVIESMSNIMGVETMHWGHLRYWLGEHPNPAPVVRK